MKKLLKDNKELTLFQLIDRARLGLELPNSVEFDGYIWELKYVGDPGQDYVCSSQDEEELVLSMYAFDPHGALDCIVWKNKDTK